MSFLQLVLSLDKTIEVINSILENVSILTDIATKMSQLARRAAREAQRKRVADSEEEYKPPVKVAKAKSKRSSPRSKAGKTKPNTSAYGKVTDIGGVYVPGFITKRRKRFQILTLP